MRHKKEQHIFSKCENVVLEAKRVLLNQSLDKIVNAALSENALLFKEVILDTSFSHTTMYEDIFSLDLDINTIEQKFHYCESSNLEDTVVVKEPISKNEDLPSFRNDVLLKKYFYKWKEYSKQTDLHASKKQIQETKINEFITTLKNRQQTKCFNTKPTRCKSSILKPAENFKNRYKVQNHIIDMQKEKIEEQNKIIDELKLGIIREDLFKSVETTKHTIKEIFGNCSGKLICEAPLVKAIEEREKIMINAQKAPKVVHRLEQRAIERKKYREEILKRKREKEEARQVLLREMIEKKKFLEEEERKKKLEIIDEQRKHELKLQKIKQEKKEQFERKVLIAVNFYNKLLIKQCFKKLLNVYNKRIENNSLAKAVFVHKEKLKIFRAWLGYVDAKYKIKYDIADSYFSYKMLVQFVNKWKEFKLECVRSLQVAEDFYDFKLTCNTFVHWHRYVCKEIMIEHKKSQVAIKHNNRRLLFQSFYRWRYLPVVIQLEKSKEETKRKWREKVWEILPDYQPPDII